MSSVSYSSKFSVKSQQVIAEQDVVIAKQVDQIARMKRMLTEAGIDPYCISPTQKLSWCTVLYQETGKVRKQCNLYMQLVSWELQ